MSSSERDKALTFASAESKAVFDLRGTRLGLSQRRFADLFGTRYATVQNVEQGRGAPRLLTPLCLQEVQVYNLPAMESLMFELGRRYRITTSDHDGAGSSSATVIAWEAPLLKIECLGSYQIINTAAPQFVGAEPDDEAHHAAKIAAAKDITDSLSIRYMDEG